jgi:hypothetical protein
LPKSKLPRRVLVDAHLCLLCHFRMYFDPFFQEYLQRVEKEVRVFTCGVFGPLIPNT